MSNTPPTPPDDESQLPPQGLRTVLSFLIFLHLFALFVAVSSNIEPTSALREQFTAVPLVHTYLQTLYINEALNNSYTYDRGEVDLDHHVELVLDVPGGGKRVLRLPEEANAWPNLQANRYQHLMYNMALASHLERNGLEQLDENALPAAIAAGVLHNAGIAEGAHRFQLVGEELIPAKNVLNASPQLSDPHDKARRLVHYEADVVFAGSDLVLNKRAESRLSVPIQNVPALPQK